MTRIFFILATFSLLLLIAAFALGLGVGKLDQNADASTLRWATVHRLTGVAAALAVVLVNSIVVTYFIGTSRWCKEVSETYRLPPVHREQSTRIKRHAFPWALTGMLTVVGLAALGAAADPATGRPNTSDWTPFHLAGALIGIPLIAWCYFSIWNELQANLVMIQGVMAQVERIRAKGSLPDVHVRPPETEPCEPASSE